MERFFLSFDFSIPCASNDVRLDRARVRHVAVNIVGTVGRYLVVLQHVRIKGWSHAFPSDSSSANNEVFEYRRRYHIGYDMMNQFQHRK